MTPKYYELRNSCNKQWQSYRPIYFFLCRQPHGLMESNVSLCGSEVTVKIIKQLEVEGMCPMAGDANAHVLLKNILWHCGSDRNGNGVLYVWPVHRHGAAVHVFVQRLQTFLMYFFIFFNLKVLYIYGTGHFKVIKQSLQSVFSEPQVYAAYFCAVRFGG